MKYMLIEENSGQEVKPGMNVLSFKNEVFKVTGFLSPRYIGCTGRVLVRKPEDLALPHNEYMCYPSVFGLEIVEVQDDITNC